MRGGCTPKMTRCAATCLHYQRVNDYQQERQRQEAAAEEASNGYDAELRDFLATEPLITFKQWLIGTKR